MNVLRGRLKLGDDSARMVKKNLTHRGGADSTPTPLEHARAEHGLQFLQTARDHRLGNSELIGGTLNGALIGDRDHQNQMAHL